MLGRPRARARSLGASLAVLVLAAPLAAQETGGSLSGSVENLVTDQLSTPDVSALPAPSERVGAYADVNNARIFYQTSGDGPALLLLHGYPLSGALFGRVREALQDDWTVITLDHRGYGLSDAPETRASIEVYAKDALAVLDHLGIEKAAIGGMSMGGPITLSMYQMAPERFSGMILIDTTAAPAGPPEAGLWRGIESVIADKGMAPIMTALLPDMVSGEMRLTNPAYGDYLVEVMKGATDRAGRDGALALAERPDFTDLLGKIDVPTLVMVGVEDALYSVEVSRKMAGSIPNASLAILPGASHAAVFEAAGSAAGAIQAWGATLQ